MMKISYSGISLIKTYTMFSGRAVQDSYGIWTIGYGHKNCVSPKSRINKISAEKLLYKDLIPIETYLNGIKQNWSQNEFDAMCSFVLDIGISSFNVSPVKQHVINNEHALVPMALTKYVRIDGEAKYHLAHRRTAEVALYLGI